MENRYYDVHREDVYVGRVVRIISGLYRFERQISGVTKSIVDVNHYVTLRPLFFVLNREKLADDLLYNSPQYPVLGITQKGERLNLQPGRIAIKNICNLEPLLEFAGFDSNLSYRDIVDIKRILFSHHASSLNEILIRLCAQKGLYYERDYNLQEDFMTIMTSYFGSSELAEYFLENLLDSISDKRSFQPNFLSEPGTKRLSFIPKNK